jgi:hypothetical protein
MFICGELYTAGVGGFKTTPPATVTGPGHVVAAARLTPD